MYLVNTSRNDCPGEQLAKNPGLVFSRAFSVTVSQEESAVACKSILLWLTASPGGAGSTTVTLPEGPTVQRGLVPDNRKYGGQHAQEQHE